MEQNGSFRTSDLALATYLIMNGLDYELAEDHESEDPTCVWVFQVAIDPRSTKLIKDYHSRTARVEPNRFVRIWGLTRSEMLKFLYK